MRERPLTVIKGYVYTLHRSECDPAKAAKLDVDAARRRLLHTPASTTALPAAADVADT
jgi:hypothetical protein